MWGERPVCAFLDEGGLDSCGKCLFVTRIMPSYIRLITEVRVCIDHAMEEPRTCQVKEFRLSSYYLSVLGNVPLKSHPQNHISLPRASQLVSHDYI